MFAQYDSGTGGGGLLVVFIAAGVVLFGLPVYGILKKAGRTDAWLGFIPIVNLVLLFEIVGRPGWWIVLLLIPLVNIVVVIILWYELSVSFGHGVGFTIGLVLLNWIFLLVLAFGSSQHVGPGPRGVVSGSGAPMPPPPV